MLRQRFANLGPRARVWLENAAEGTRAFAAAPKELTLPPQHGVPGRYAAALYLAAAKANKLQAVEGELASIAKMMADSQDFSTFVFDPSLPRKAKIEGLDGVLGKMGASDLTKNFMRLLCDNNRVDALHQILERFEDIAADQKGQVKAKVTTAQKLTSQEIDEVQNGLKKLLKPGQSLILEQTVDPSIIGGAVIDIGDRHVDMSILSRVRKLQNIIRETV